MAVKLTNQLIRIPEGCSIVRANNFENYDELIISRPIPEERVCPSCGSSHCVVKSAMEYHSARHIAISHRPTICLLCPFSGPYVFKTPQPVVS